MPANPPMGDDFIEGSLGVVDITFDSVNLGKTVDEAVLEPIVDRKEIKYAQDGTQPADFVVTGQAYKVTCKIGQPTWARLKKVMYGLTVAGHSALLGRDLYRSILAAYSKVLILKRVDSNGNPSAVHKYWLTCWKALPLVNGAIATFGPDTQRTVTIEWLIVFDATKGHEGFGYSGSSTTLGIY
jgi:hypothetical protein